ncbi:ShTK domain protein, partial [Trichostrongylus colubriformis]
MTDTSRLRSMVLLTHTVPFLLTVSLIVLRVNGIENGCDDADPKCPEWAAEGECTSNAVWMMANCRKSCHSCQGGDKAWKLRTHIQANYHNASESSTRIVRIESVRVNNVEI